MIIAVREVVVLRFTDPAAATEFAPKWVGCGQDGFEPCERRPPVNHQMKTTGRTLPVTRHIDLVAFVPGSEDCDRVRSEDEGLGLAWRSSGEWSGERAEHEAG